MNPFLALIFCISITFEIVAQPDLQTFSLSIKGATTVQTADRIIILAKIKNTGNIASSTMRIAFFISSAINDTNGLLLGLCNVEPLQPQQETDSIEFISPISSLLASGNYYLQAKTDIYREVSETNENNNMNSVYPLTINSTASTNQNLPYPVILIHGINSDHLKWNKFIGDMKRSYGFSFGGNMDFCLNADENNAIALVANDYIDFTALNNSQGLKAADLYTVNFNVKANGNFGADYQSDQSAIYKEGFAIRDAIKHVLSITGKNKVIIIAHSMGGLAARDYLQNSGKWQTDSQHHIAKLFTIGTPHGGSNMDSYGVVNSLTGLDEAGEGTRDIRYSYTGGSPGRFLFGGTENNTSMRWGLFNSYHTIDVNCNGIIGDNIVGINNMPIPKNLDYSCIIGTGYFLGGDGIVNDQTRANINNYPAAANLQADTFMIDAKITSFILHNDLPFYTRQIMQGADESVKFYNAYDIDLQNWYFGQITVQSPVNVNFPFDVDIYKLSVPTTGIYTFKLNNILSDSVLVDLFSAADTITSIHSYSNSKKGNIANTLALTAGDYYLKIKSLPLDSSWKTMYALNINANSLSAIKENNIDDSFLIYPNPVTDNITITNKFGITTSMILKIYSAIGSLIVYQPFYAAETTVNIQQLHPGIYTLELSNETEIVRRKLIVK